MESQKETRAEPTARETIELTIQWLDNLERFVGTMRFLDTMPNNFGGRTDLRKLLEVLEC